MYKNHLNKRAPLASWMLDDTVPFQEYAGFGASGGKKTATSDPTKSVALVSGTAFSSVFKSTSIGQFACNLFKQGRERQSFALEAWILPVPKTTTGNQSILSHDGIFDGLSINGTVIRFGTSYLTQGNAFCDYDLIFYRRAHVVGVHTFDQNQLWVNGQLVASVDITDAQKADTYVATDGYLYSGYTTSTQEIAMNGVAFYASLDGDQIYQNYLAGTEVPSQQTVFPQYGGAIIDIDKSDGNIFLSESWDTSDDFDEGLKNNVEYSDTLIVPTYVSGTSAAGSWTVAVPLDLRGDTSIHGVAVTWDGRYITVDYSLDGTSWSAATNGKLVSIIANNYNPTNKDLQIRVNFAGGSTADPAYLDKLSVVGFRDNTINNITARTVTASHPSILREDTEPFEYRDDGGVYLNGGTLTIGTDGSTDPEVARTLEVWLKPVSGTTTISVAGTKYRNGALDSTLPNGEWSLIHYVAAADITTNITIAGDCIVNSVVLYPTALSATEVDAVWDAYTGAAALRLLDTGSVSVTEGATPSSIYAHDWSIDTAF